MFTSDGHEKNGPSLVILCPEIEHNEFTPVYPLKFRFTVLPKLKQKMTLHTDFSDMKKNLVSYPVFNREWLTSVRTFWDTLYIDR